MLKTTHPLNNGGNQGRAARAIVLVNGVAVKFDSWRVETSGFSTADTFELTLPFFIQDALGNQLPILANGPGFTTKLLTTDVIKVQIFAGYPKNPASVQASNLTFLLDGQMDTARWSFSMSGEHVTLSGRNRVGPMEDTKIVEKFPNQTASQIATMFAKQNGLTPVVTATTTPVGTYYNQQSSMLSNAMSQWDLLVYLAKLQDFVLRVKPNASGTGSSLYFGPYDTVIGADAAKNPLLYTNGYDIRTLEIERSPHAARNIRVKVISFSGDSKTQVSGEATTESTLTASSTTQQAQRLKQQIGKRAAYTKVVTVYGLTKDQAQKRAEQIYADLSRKQVLGTLTRAGDTNASIDRVVVLNGLGQGLSAKYYMNHIVHTWRMPTGDEDEEAGYGLEASFSAETDYSIEQQQHALQDTPDGSQVLGAGSVTGQQIATRAARFQGQFPYGGPRVNTCGAMVNKVLAADGISLTSLGVANPNYVPSYANLGQTITSVGALQPGDIVVTGNQGHVGIYYGNGQMWGISTVSGYIWELQTINSGPSMQFYAGHRI